jgi:hypothetical protein
MSLRSDIEDIINKNSAENGSHTPDYILAEYLLDCLKAFDNAVSLREKWYGRQDFDTIPTQSGPISEG